VVKVKNLNGDYAIEVLLVSPANQVQRPCLHPLPPGAVRRRFPAAFGRRFPQAAAASLRI